MNKEITITLNAKEQANVMNVVNTMTFYNVSKDLRDVAISASFKSIDERLAHNDTEQPKVTLTAWQWKLIADAIYDLVASPLLDAPTDPQATAGLQDSLADTQADIESVL